MERTEEEVEEKVFVCSMAYSALMDSDNNNTDQDEKQSIAGASTSGASSGTDSNPGSPTPLVAGEQVVEVGRNGISFTHVRHSPLFRTRLPHLSAHSLALSAGSRKPRHHSSYSTEGQYAQPQSYNKWSRQRGQNSKWTRRQRFERIFLWLAIIILVVLLIVGIMIAIFWMPLPSGQDVAVMNNTNTTTGSRDSGLSVSLTTTLSTVTTAESAVTVSTLSVTATVVRTSSTLFPFTVSGAGVTPVQGTSTVTTQLTAQSINKRLKASTVTTLLPTSSVVAASVNDAVGENRTHTTVAVPSTRQNQNISSSIEMSGGKNSTEKPP